ncbi:MAG: hypothetical protein ACLPX8_22750 [Bryobacteraceae bacterium]
MRAIASQLNGELKHFIDIGISDGSTSVDMVSKLDREFGSTFLYTATDRDGHFIVIRDGQNKHRRVIVDQNYSMVQAIVPPFVYCTLASRDNLLLFPINRLYRPVAMKYARKLIARCLAGDSDLSKEEISFFSSDFSLLLKNNPNVKFEQWDINLTWPGKEARCIRAMNLLNPEYFSSATITIVVGNLLNAVEEGGLIAVGSNEEAGSIVHGAIYKKVESGLELLTLTGNGPPCADAFLRYLK